MELIVIFFMIFTVFMNDFVVLIMFLNEFQSFLISS